jgi:hypothetical protein
MTSIQRQRSSSRPTDDRPRPARCRLPDIVHCIILGDAAFRRREVVGTATKSLARQRRLIRDRNIQLRTGTPPVTLREPGAYRRIIDRLRMRDGARHYDADCVSWNHHNTPAGSIM